MDLCKVLLSLLNCNGDSVASTSRAQCSQDSQGMQNETSSEEQDNEAAGPGPSRINKVPANNASPIAAEMLAHLLKTRPPLGQLMLVAPGCDSNPGSPSTSPTAVSPSSSADKIDNRDPFVIYPDAPDMRREEERLKTFDKWPVTFLSPQLLARNGFYYLGRGDEVRCAFCKVEIMKWVEGDDPAKDHQRWAPQCTFLRRQASSGNVPMESSPTTAGRDECGVRAAVTPNPIRMPGPVHPRYASEAARLRSFSDWPRSMRQKPEELAEAGFFYTGQGDKTKCFYCDGGLKDWENDDVPWEQHARWFHRCAYVQLVKGKEYIQKVISEASVIPAPAEDKEPKAPPSTSVEKPSEKEASPVEDTKLCRICYNEERNVCFVPCGHVVACAKCALSTDKCPMCRRTFTNAVRLYFS
ncbi:death-associated inhibitor of apoptosis 1-like isoform X1 [Maniola jurtina]|uniref:death-associated inhibitor of apoptosis 1-like isoform X1 n=2 Tax=Maniola jurtina TaxID=191418 RepID=UPI001E68BC18|nr:death-associated inhibitor of apoptosis 1-like isoform X1 [Maniola jurtina]